MVAEKKFCTNCGNPIDTGARFCAYCGQPLNQIHSNAAPANQIEATTSSTSITPQPGIAANTNGPAAKVDFTPSAEQIVGVIPGISRKKGMFNYESYHIIVTPKRLIFAAVTNEIMKDEAQKSSGKGMGSYLKTALAGNDFTQRYLNMHPSRLCTKVLKILALISRVFGKSKLKKVRCIWTVVNKMKVNLLSKPLEIIALSC